MLFSPPGLVEKLDAEIDDGYGDDVTSHRHFTTIIYLHYHIHAHSIQLHKRTYSELKTCTTEVAFSFKTGKCSWAASETRKC